MNPYTPPASPAADATLMEECADYLIELGIAPKVAKPKLYRFLWSRGFGLRPPLYASFLQRFLIQGVFLAFFWGKGMHIMGKLDHGFPIDLLAPLFFGVTMTLVFQLMARDIRRNHKLPAWEELQLLVSRREGSAGE